MELESRGVLRLLKSGDCLRKECEDLLIVKKECQRGRGRPRKEVEESSVLHDKNERRIETLVAEAAKECEEESIEVKRINIEGNNYLISKRKILYCPESHEEIGSYLNNELVLCE
jgi:hypothetical protein